MQAQQIRGAGTPYPCILLGFPPLHWQGRTRRELLLPLSLPTPELAAVTPPPPRLGCKGPSEPRGQPPRRRQRRKQASAVSRRCLAAAAAWLVQSLRLRLLPQPCGVSTSASAGEGRGLILPLPSGSGGGGRELRSSRGAPLAAPAKEEGTRPPHNQNKTKRGLSTPPPPPPPRLLFLPPRQV